MNIRKGTFTLGKSLGVELDAAFARSHHVIGVPSMFLIVRTGVVC